MAGIRREARGALRGAPYPSRGPYRKEHHPCASWSPATTATSAASWCPCCRRGTRSSGFDADFFEPCLLGGRTGGGPARKDLRDVEGDDLEGLRRGRPPAGLSNDPLGDLDSRCTYDINDAASIRLARLAKAGRASRASSSPPRAASTARPATTSSTRAPPFNPVTPYGVSKVRVERSSPSSPTTASPPPYLRNATAYGVSPAAAGRPGGQQPRRLRVTTGRVQHHERRHALAAAGARRGHRPRLPRRARGAARGGPRPGLQRRPRPRENYQIRELAEIVAETVPGCRITYAEGAGRTSAATGSTAARSARAARLRAAMDGARRHRGARRRLPRRAGSPSADFEGSRFIRLKTP